ncbi:MAG: hypothetical protein C4518_13095 [Desulfobacteraceae bacterium]|nr:MAG: hypothetical protein C4518_13095 [Desulfobacteraceae bacterium]
MDKKPKKVKRPNSVKIPRKDSSLTDTSSITPVWQTGVIDVDGPWGWKDIEHNLFFTTILPTMQNFETMTWFEILGRNNHEVKIQQLIKPAQKRLAFLSLDDFESLVSLRLTGPQRVWGIKIQNVFKILWWDPKHEVCPSQLKHT